MVTELYEHATPDTSGDVSVGPQLPSDDDAAFEGQLDSDGWRYNDEPLQWLFGTEGRGKLVMHAIQAVADGDPIFENKSALAKSADVSRHSVHRHIEELEDLNIYERKGGDGTHIRHRPNENSRVVAALFQANHEVLEYVDTEL